MTLLRLTPAAILLLAACEQPAPPPAAPADPPAAGPSEPRPAAVPPAAPAVPAPPAAAPKPLPGEALIRSRWAAADNRAGCAPLFLTDLGAGGGATPRAATFGGGWGVAFDLPGERSAFGVAGTGVAVTDAAEQVARIRAQWPYARRLDGRSGQLPAGSAAGYGREGAQDYFAEDPQGRSAKSLAYVVIPGQRCLYNVWSGLGRDHLERLLDGLTLKR